MVRKEALSSTGSRLTTVYWLVTYLAIKTMLCFDDNVSRETDSETQELLPSSFPDILKNAEGLVSVDVLWGCEPVVYSLVAMAL